MKEIDRILLLLFREAEMTVTRRKSRMITETEMHINGKTYIFTDTFSPQRSWKLTRNGEDMTDLDLMVLYAECDLRRKVDELPPQE